MVKWRMTRSNCARDQKRTPHLILSRPGTLKLIIPIISDMKYTISRDDGLWDQNSIGINSVQQQKIIRYSVEENLWSVIFFQVKPGSISPAPPYLDLYL